MYTYKNTPVKTVKTFLQLRQQLRYLTLGE